MTCVADSLVVPTSQRWSWERRKALHYLSVIWAFSICFHAPLMHIAYLVGIPLGLYALDYVYGTFFRTYKISYSTFKRIECGVELTFEHPNGFVTDIGGYVLVCVPWLAKKEWHAFSVYRQPNQPNMSSVCMLKAGDWTSRLHSIVERNTKRPVWISGPFASPYSTAVDFDNLVLVASGIGITPALSIIASHKHTRRVNLIWSCRDASLVEYFLEHADWPHDSWTLIYYTGKRKLQLSDKLPQSVLIFAGRPSWEAVLCEVIRGIETGDSLPESIVSQSEAYETALREYATALRAHSSALREDRLKSGPNDTLARFGRIVSFSLSGMESNLEEFRGRVEDVATQEEIDRTLQAQRNALRRARGSKEHTSPTMDVSPTGRRGSRVSVPSILSMSAGGQALSSGTASSSDATSSPTRQSRASKEGTGSATGSGIMPSFTRQSRASKEGTGSATGNGIIPSFTRQARASKDGMGSATGSGIIPSFTRQARASKEGTGGGNTSSSRSCRVSNEQKDESTPPTTDVSPTGRRGRRVSLPSIPLMSAGGQARASTEGTSSARKESADSGNTPSGRARRPSIGLLTGLSSLSSVPTVDPTPAAEDAIQRAEPTISASGISLLIHSMMPEMFTDAEVSELIQYFALSQEEAEKSPPKYDNSNETMPLVGLPEVDESSNNARVSVSKLKSFLDDQGKGTESGSLKSTTEVDSTFVSAKDLFTNAKSMSVEKSKTETQTGSFKADAKLKLRTLATAIGHGSVDYGHHRLKAWQVLYCGGTQAIVDTLQRFSTEFGVAFKKEKFDW